MVNAMSPMAWPSSSGSVLSASPPPAVVPAPAKAGSFSGSGCEFTVGWWLYESRPAARNDYSVGLRACARAASPMSLPSSFAPSAAASEPLELAAAVRAAAAADSLSLAAAAG